MSSHSGPHRRATHLGSARIVSYLLGGLSILCAALAFGGSAHAQDDDDQAIFGQLTYKTEEGETIAVPDVEIIVEGVGSVVSDENGDFRIAVPDGEYSVDAERRHAAPGDQPARRRPGRAARSAGHRWNVEPCAVPDRHGRDRRRRHSQHDQLPAARPAHRRRPEDRSLPGDGGDRSVADLRYHRARQLRPRRARHVGDAQHLLLQLLRVRRCDRFHGCAGRRRSGVAST